MNIGGRMTSIVCHPHKADWIWAAQPGTDTWERTSMANAPEQSEAQAAVGVVVRWLSKKGRRDDERVNRVIVGQAPLTSVGLISRTQRLFAVSAETQPGI
jgi:hypothetical protein